MEYPNHEVYKPVKYFTKQISSQKIYSVHLGQTYHIPVLFVFRNFCKCQLSYKSFVVEFALISIII